MKFAELIKIGKREVLPKANQQVAKRALFSFVLGVFLALTPQHEAAAAKKGDEAVAVVNGQNITAGALQREIQGITARVEAQGKKLSEAEQNSLKEATLEKLVKLELLGQESKKANIVAGKADIDKEIDGFRKGFPDSKAFTKALSDAGVTEAELRKQIGKNIAIQKFIDSRFKSKAQVSEQEAKAFYNGNQDKFSQPELAHARHILIASKATESKEERERKRAKLVQIKKQIKGGADFAELAKQSSDCPSKERGGDLGFFPKGQMVKPFEQAVFKLNPGEVSDVVETEFGFHLIRLEEKRAAKTVSFDDAKANIVAYLTQEKVTAGIEAFLAEVKSKATIKILNPQAKK